MGHPAEILKCCCRGPCACPMGGRFPASVSVTFAGMVPNYVQCADYGPCPPGSGTTNYHGGTGPGVPRQSLVGGPVNGTWDVPFSGCVTAEATVTTHCNNLPSSETGYFRIVSYAHSHLNPLLGAVTTSSHNHSNGETCEDAQVVDGALICVFLFIEIDGPRAFASVSYRAAQHGHIPSLFEHLAPIVISRSCRSFTFAVDNDLIYNTCDGPNFAGSVPLWSVAPGGTATVTVPAE